MLVRFSSPKTESILMFGESAIRLIKMLGATGHVPGAIAAEDIPKALVALRQHLQQADDVAENDEHSRPSSEQQERERPIDLATRAGPLIQILERAAKLNAPVMWDKT